MNDHTSTIKLKTACTYFFFIIFEDSIGEKIGRYDFWPGVVQFLKKLHLDLGHAQVALSSMAPLSSFDLSWSLSPRIYLSSSLSLLRAPTLVFLPSYLCSCLAALALFPNGHAHMSPVMALSFSICLFPCHSLPLFGVGFAFSGGTCAVRTDGCCTALLNGCMLAGFSERLCQQRARTAVHRLHDRGNHASSSPHFHQAHDERRHQAHAPRIIVRRHPTGATHTGWMQRVRQRQWCRMGGAEGH